jgi:hypothetical protein
MLDLDKQIDANYIISYFRHRSKKLNEKGWSVKRKTCRNIATIILDNNNIKKTLLFDTNTVPYSKDALHCRTRQEFYEHLINTIEIELCIQNFFLPESNVARYKKLKDNFDNYLTQNIKDIKQYKKYNNYNFTNYLRSFFSTKTLRKFNEFGWSFSKSSSKGVVGIMFTNGLVEKCFFFNTKAPTFDKEMIQCRNINEFYKHYYRILKEELKMPDEFYTDRDIANQDRIKNIKENDDPLAGLFYQSYQVDNNDNILGEINEKPEEVKIQYTLPPEKKYIQQPNYFQFI